MIPTDPDKELREEIAYAFELTDLCTSDPTGIDAALDSSKAPQWNQDKVDRILKKAAGALPVGERAAPDVSEEENEPAGWSEATATEDERQLAYMCRNEGGTMPQEVEAKLARFREQAKNIPVQENSSG